MRVPVSAGVLSRCCNYVASSRREGMAEIMQRLARAGARLCILEGCKRQVKGFSFHISERVQHVVGFVGGCVFGGTCHCARSVFLFPVLPLGACFLFLLAL